MNKTSGKKWVKFEFNAHPKSEVFVAGTFNDWNDRKMKLKEEDAGVYQTSLLVPPGRHEYKFIVDGRWCPDPNCGERVSNALGSQNSVINVG